MSPLAPGDVVEVEITGLGKLINTVAETPAPAAKVGHEPTQSDAVKRIALGSDYRSSKSG